MSRLDCRPVRSDERGHSGGQISGKFMAVASLWLITTALALLVSCQWSPFPRNPLNAPHPYRMKVVRLGSIVPPEVFADLDHDGVDEILGLSKIYSTFTPSFLQIYNSRFETIQRVNFNGLIQNLFCYDWNGDGIDEIFLPFTRNDSTFLRIIDHRGNILIRSAFLFTGKARVDSSGYYPWQGKILQMFYADINADEKNEIVVIPSEGLARAPRGVFVYDGTSLRRKWKYEIGPAISFYPYLLDPDGDGKFNILLPTSSPMNGNVANGTSDENGYLILLGPDGEVLSQEKLTGAFGGINARVADLDHDGRQEILLMLTNALEPQRFRLEMRDAASLKLLRSFALTGAAGFEIAQLNHEPEMEIVV
ncbi:MAG: VCBS repeat-containing protein, partial [Calditrichaeota bacterium]